MKKSIRIIAMALVAIMLCMSLASCGKKLNGTYEADGILGLGEVKLEFSGNKVEYSYTLAGKVVSQNGTYKIDGDTITFEWVDEDGEKLENAKLDGEYVFEEKDNGDIVIGTTEYEIAD